MSSSKQTYELEILQISKEPAVYLTYRTRVLVLY